MVDRRTFIKTASCLSLAGIGGLPAASFAKSVGPELGDNGLYVQPYFLESFLNLAEDHEEAAGQKKTLAVIWEQRGCPYCRELHSVNLMRKPIADFLKKNFVVVQLDLWGSREVTDFDGKAMEERKLARRWAVNFTPTMQFFPPDAKAIKGKDGRSAEVFRMPGYFKPFHFMSMLEFVHNRAYQKTGFQRYLQDKFTEYRKSGKKIDVW